MNTPPPPLGVSIHSPCTINDQVEDVTQPTNKNCAESKPMIAGCSTVLNLATSHCPLNLFNVLRFHSAADNSEFINFSEEVSNQEC